MKLRMASLLIQVRMSNNSEVRKKKQNEGKAILPYFFEKIKGVIEKYQPISSRVEVYS